MRTAFVLGIAIAAAAAACTTTHTETDRLDCNSCHATEYDTSAQITPPCDPALGPIDHVARGYDRTCYACHGTASWCPADDSHTEFNLTRTAHAGYDCADCHLAISYEPPAVTDATQITCTNCHWHDQARTDPLHLGNGDYEYAPAACLECHGRGGRD